MGIERYKVAFNKLLKSLDPIATKYHTSKIRILWDAAYSALRYGVTPNQYIGFQFWRCSSIEKKLFYTARDQNKYDKQFNDPAHYDDFWNKVKFNQKFTDFIKRDWLFAPDHTIEEIDEFLQSHPKIIIKPTNLSSGRGIEVYRGQFSPQECQQSGILLEEFCHQHHEMTRLNPSSVNTVRMYTILDQAGTPHIISVMIRIGGSNAEVDNYHAGGVGYPVDTETGYVCGPGYDINGNSFYVHPSTGEKVIGFEIPNYNELVRFVFDATAVVPTARLIAWDVAVLEDGFEFIEGNYDGDSGFMQTPSKTGKRFDILGKL